MSTLSTIEGAAIRSNKITMGGAKRIRLAFVKVIGVSLLTIW
jgi:hypothetical protein